jgi:hypothetical protein
MQQCNKDRGAIKLAARDAACCAAVQCTARVVNNPLERLLGVVRKRTLATELDRRPQKPYLQSRTPRCAMFAV